MLQRDAQGRYRRLAGRPSSSSGSSASSCSQLTDGKCPIAVPIRGSSCLVTCVAAEEDCQEMNPSTPGIDRFRDPFLCTSCDITACSSCKFSSAGDARCEECYPGFLPRDGKCIIWGEETLVFLTKAVFAVLMSLVVLVLLGTIIGGLRSLRKPPQGKGINEGLLSVDQGGKVLHNKQSIYHGLTMSLQTSIKLNSYFGIQNVDNDEGAASHPGALKQLFVAFFNNADLGLGLKLFFNTQLFMIFMSLLLWALVELGFVLRGGAHDISAADVEQQCLLPGRFDFEKIQTGVVRMNESYARTNQDIFIAFWAVALLASWAFHYYQKWCKVKYDQDTQSSEDYSLELRGVPPMMMSEKKLKSILEKELNMEGKIHGVCICYDVLSLPEEDQERLKCMVEHVVEYDDLFAKWYPEHLLHPRNQYEEAMAQDSVDFKDMLQTKLRNSGRCYVTFKQTRAMLKVLRERKGISKSILTSQGGPSEDELQMMQVNLSRDEPAGLRFYKMELTDSEKSKERQKLCVRQIMYIMVYILVAHLFNSYYLRPWKNIGVGDASAEAPGVKIVGMVVLLLNVAIQTAVMMDIEECSLVRISRIDQLTFIFNTLLLVITLGYTLLQECNKDGWRMDLVPGPLVGEEGLWMWKQNMLRAMGVEIGMVYSVKNVFVDQTVMLYILGEVGNVLAPVAINWIALRAVFVYNIGGSHTSKVQRLLRSILPSCKKEVLLTPREAEKAQSLAPLALWMEYSYLVVFPFIACYGIFLIGPFRQVCKAQAAFAIIFFVWQRYVMLWLYGKMQYDGDDTYFAFIVLWGLVISFFPASFAWWSYRLGDIAEPRFAAMLMVAIYMLTVLIYWAGILAVERLYGKGNKEADDMGAAGDPGYASLIEKTGLSWWNVNPIYVLKQRYCPDDLPGFEVHSQEVQCWPSWSKDKGFFEPGTVFRHRKKRE